MRPVLPDQTVGFVALAVISIICSVMSSHLAAPCGGYSTRLVFAIGTKRKSQQNLHNETGTWEWDAVECIWRMYIEDRNIDRNFSPEVDLELVYIHKR